MTNRLLAQSLNEFLIANEQEFSREIYLRQPKGNQWIEFTWGQTIDQARRVATFLQQSGLKKGDRVAIFSKNCAEWYIVDFGISLAGMVSVPLFVNQREESIHYVLENAKVKFIFVGKVDEVQRVITYLPTSIPSASLGYHEELKITSWQTVLAESPLKSVYYPKKDDYFTIMYTSGTAGPPKGVVFTHGIISNYLALYPQDLRSINEGPFYSFLSYLPLAHVYERSAIALGSVVVPSTVSFIESLERFVDNLRDAQPTFFGGVPRVWTAFQEKILKKLPEKRLYFLLAIPGISFLLKRFIKSKLGLAKCANFFSGASPLSTSVLTFFNKIGIPILEGYGQTEDLAYATVSHLGTEKPGYVGKPRLNVEIKLGDDHEILVKSPCLMKGYYRNKAATNRAFTQDGWLRTGDIGEIDKQNRVKIVGRLSEIYKNQQGEFVSPREVEDFFALNYLDQVCLSGQGLTVNVMIATLNQVGQNMPRESLVNILQRDLRSINQRLAKHEKVGKILVVKGPWTAENGFLTPTFKIRRGIIENHYEVLLKTTTEQAGVIFWE